MEWKHCETMRSDKTNGIEQSEYPALWNKRDTGTVTAEALFPSANQLQTHFFVYATHLPVTKENSSYTTKIIIANFNYSVQSSFRS
jgi:hypothetical protein